MMSKVHLHVDAKILCNSQFFRYNHYGCFKTLAGVKNDNSFKSFNMLFVRQNVRTVLEQQFVLVNSAFAVLCYVE